MKERLMAKVSSQILILKIDKLKNIKWKSYTTLMKEVGVIFR